MRVNRDTLNTKSFITSYLLTCILLAFIRHVFPHFTLSRLDHSTLDNFMVDSWHRAVDVLLYLNSWLYQNCEVNNLLIILCNTLSNDI